MNNTTKILQLLALFESDVIEFKELLELTGFIGGIKQIVRLTGTIDKLDAINKSLNSEGLELTYPGFVLEKCYSNELSDTFYKIVPKSESSNDSLLVAFLGDKTTVDKAIRIESQGCDDIKTAELYGYPDCCANNYIRIREGEFWVDSFILNCKIYSVQDWKMNKIAYLFEPCTTFIPDYFTCSVDCIKTLNLVDSYIQLFESQKLDVLIELIKSHQTALVLIYNGKIRYFKNYHLENGVYYILNAHFYYLDYTPNIVDKIEKDIVRIVLRSNSFILIDADNQEIDIEISNDVVKLIEFK